MEIARLLIVLAIYFVFRYFIRNRSANSAATMSHGKVTPVDNPVIFKALTSSGPVVVDFFATWCGPCKAIAPVVGKLSETYTDVRFLQVDVDKARSIAQEHEIRAMPTFVLYKDGKLLDKRVVGGNMKELEEQIKNIIA
ncbi:thioredoxin family protein [Aspergillus puulaauensis]|uniref:Thioredoxin domain-containing protein n=1 Tax=Aspergillus puulaauensis TaxID=1220207 RepID=A0A7R7XUW2_9EURO|nr:uncharacterized protein APUU_60967A [Aspergillus puulaauensis]BCS27919.1 hypothetical protein APUU_60967A [Aspergillus puulaauensis]